MSEPSTTNGGRTWAAPAFRPDPSHRIVQHDHQTRAASLLRQVAFFREVPPHHLRELARFAQVESFAAGDEIIRAGELGSTMYVICSGRVNVVRERAVGDPVVLASLGPGEVFGELSIFDSETRSATVVATEDSELLTLGRIDLVRVVDRNPALALSLLKSLSARLRAANDRLAGSPSAPPS